LFKKTSFMRFVAFDADWNWVPYWCVWRLFDRDP
jgi:hypothetical protein